MDITVECEDAIIFPKSHDYESFWGRDSNGEWVELRIPKTNDKIVKIKNVCCISESMTRLTFGGGIPTIMENGVLKISYEKLIKQLYNVIEKIEKDNPKCSIEIGIFINRNKED